MADEDFLEKVKANKQVGLVKGKVAGILYNSDTKKYIVEVEDIEATFNQLKESGAEVKYAPTKKPWGAVLAALHDPDGNVFGLTQRGTNPDY